MTIYQYYLNYTYRNYTMYGVKELSNPDLLYTKPKAHTDEEEMFEDKRRKSKLPRSIAEDNPVLGDPR